MGFGGVKKRGNQRRLLPPGLTGERFEGDAGRPGGDFGATPAAPRGRMFFRTQSITSCVEVPGVNTAFTPAFLRKDTSSSGMIPPPKTGIETPALFNRSMTRGKRVLWAPLRMLRDTASTSSWMAVATTISGV